MRRTLVGVLAMATLIALFALVLGCHSNQAQAWEQVNKDLKKLHAIQKQQYQRQIWVWTEVQKRKQEAKEAKHAKFDKNLR